MSEGIAQKISDGWETISSIDEDLSNVALTPYRNFSVDQRNQHKIVSQVSADKKAIAGETISGTFLGRKIQFYVTNPHSNRAKIVANFQSALSQAYGTKIADFAFPPDLQKVAIAQGLSGHMVCELLNSADRKNFESLQITNQANITTASRALEQSEAALANATPNTELHQILQTAVTLAKANLAAAQKVLLSTERLISAAHHFEQNTTTHTSSADIYALLITSLSIAVVLTEVSIPYVSLALAVAGSAEMTTIIPLVSNIIGQNLAAQLTTQMSTTALTTLIGFAMIRGAGR